MQAFLSGIESMKSNPALKRDTGTQMSHSTNPRAKLLVDLPADRYRLLFRKGRVPRAGD